MGVRTEASAIAIGPRQPLPGVVYPPADRLKRYIDAGELQVTTLVDALVASFRKHADRIALCSHDGDVSYRELDEITDRFAAALIRLGLKPLERVLFQSANCKEVLFAFIGCLKAGLIPVCTLSAHREKEVGYIGNHVQASAIIVQADDSKFDLEAFALGMQPSITSLRHVISIRGQKREGIQRFEELTAAENAAAARGAVESIPRDPFQVALFQLSGGTTGVPKVIPRMQNEFLLNATLTAKLLQYRVDDVMFNPMQMIHNAAMICFWLPTLLTGAAYIIPEDMTPEAWGAAIKARRPTWLGLIRPMLPRLDAMLDQGLADLKSVRAFWCPDAPRTVRERYGIIAFGMFGMSEGMNMYTLWDDSEEARDWTVGRPMSSMDEVRLLKPGTHEDAAEGEPGELACRGPYTIAGYYRAEEWNARAFTADGFYKTGDLMIRKEIGGRVYYAFAGRLKDVVDRGREKINCEEVEAAISTYTDVSACAVVGMPDPVLGERVCAYLVLKPSGRVPTVAELGQHLQEIGLAKFKWPERIETIDTLPVTKVGKLDKAVLREDIANKLVIEAPEARVSASGRG